LLKVSPITLFTSLFAKYLPEVTEVQRSRGRRFNTEAQRGHRAAQRDREKKLLQRGRGAEIQRVRLNENCKVRIMLC
jgi:hypothetical protein